MSTNPKPLLCYVTDRRALASTVSGGPCEALLRVISCCVAAGVDWIQIREKNLPTAALRQLVASSIGMIHGSSTRILVNDRLDVAIAAGAHGVHLGEASLPPEEVVRWRNDAGRVEFLVGVSCHSVEAVRAAEAAGADYAFFGPVFTSPSKAAFGPPQGIKKLAQACAAVRIPVLAIGGIALANARECITAGAAGLAAIRLFQEAADAKTVIAELRKLSGD